jgi:predicted GNAT superfamily acetyltransferase
VEAASKAAAAAREAAIQAGVSIVELRTADAAGEAADLLADVWQTARQSTPVSAHLLQAMAHTGNYVVGAYTGDKLMGASLGWRSGDDASELHSHISGVTERVQNRGVGFALKLHQRTWSLERGFSTITWTVDPLVRRNMLFNIGKLGADVTAYLPNFYGAMNDGVNGADDSDRLMVTWRLLSERAAAACGDRGKPPQHESERGGTYELRVGANGAPVVQAASGTVRRYQIPADIVALRNADMELAAAWRRALRDTLGRVVQDGWPVRTFTREGDYVVGPGGQPIA